jgi:hypothetical protein
MHTFEDMLVRAAEALDQLNRDATKRVKPPNDENENRLK